MSLTLTYATLLSALVVSSSWIPTGNTPLDPVRTVFLFPNNTFVENLAVRSNGQILVSVLTSPQLFLFNPVQIGQPVLVQNFTGALGVGGIAEYQPDVFAVVTGNATAGTDIGAGSWAVWSVDLRGVEAQPDQSLYPPPHIYKIADVPEAMLLNGISLLSEEPSTLLVSDIGAGNIIRLDIRSGVSKVVIANDFTAAPAPLAGGVDGVHVRDGFVFVANYGKGIFAKIPINEDGTPTGNGTVIAHTLGPQDQFDDFTFDCKGNAYLVTGTGNSIERVSSDGEHQEIIAGNVSSTEITRPTSAAFGRGPFDENVLYVTTAGAQLVAISTKAVACS